MSVRSRFPAAASGERSLQHAGGQVLLDEEFAGLVAGAHERARGDIHKAEPEPRSFASANSSGETLDLRCFCGLQILPTVRKSQPASRRSRIASIISWWVSPMPTIRLDLVWRSGSSRLMVARTSRLCW